MRRFLSKCSLIVIKASLKAREIGNSKPCKNCIDFLKNAGIKKIYYSITKENIENFDESKIDDKSKQSFDHDHDKRPIYKYSSKEYLTVEKTNSIKSDHLSSKYRRPWSEFGER